MCIIICIYSILYDILILLYYDIVYIAMRASGLVLRKCNLLRDEYDNGR